MDRKTLLQLIKVAGYHNDSRAFVRLYVENRVSKTVADKHFRLGRQAKENGVKYSCSDCLKIV